MKTFKEYLEVFKFVISLYEKDEILAEQLDFIIDRINDGGIVNTELQNIQTESMQHQVNKVIESEFDTTFYLGNMKMVAKPGPNNTFRVEHADTNVYPMTRVLKREEFNLEFIEALSVDVATNVFDFLNGIQDATAFYILYTNYISKFRGMVVHLVDETGVVKFYKSPEGEDMYSSLTAEKVDFVSGTGELYQEFVDLMKRTIIASLSSRAELMNEFHKVMAAKYNEIAETC